MGFISFTRALYFSKRTPMILRSFLGPIPAVQGLNPRPCRCSLRSMGPYVSREKKVLTTSLALRRDEVSFPW